VLSGAAASTAGGTASGAAGGAAGATAGGAAGATAGGAVGGTAGATAGGVAGGTAGTAAVAGASVGTAGTATLTGITLSSATNAVLAAGISSLASQAAVSFLNNGGNLGKTLHDLGSSRTVKNVVVAMLTAGLTNAQVFDVGGKTLSLNQIAGISSIPGAGSVAQGSWNTFGQNLLGVAGRGLVSAGVSTAIQGGSFGDALRDSVVGDLAAMGAGAIGSQWGSGPNKNVALQTLAHAGLGCAAASARDKDCAAGALGGAAESVLGNLITLPTGENSGYSTGTRVLYTVGAMLAADVLSDAVGVDSLTAMDAARNAALNNRMLTGQEKDWIRARAREQAGADCAAIAGCDLQARTLYWTDLLSAVAAARDDSAEAAKLQAYQGELGMLLTRQGAEGYYGQAQRYLADFARAGAMLDAKAGQVIVGADGRAYMGRDGQPQTFFSATEQQWNDHTLNVFPGGIPNAELIAGQSARQQERLSTLRLGSGSLESVHWEEMLLVGGPVFKAGASGIREWVAGLESRGVADALGAGSVGAMRRMEFEGASYHGTFDNAIKSRGPTNGQSTLDLSVQVKSTSPRRIGVDYDSGEFVVFDSTYQQYVPRSR
jgi:hypothetical protein